MSLRSFATTLALAVGLLVILIMAFVMCVPAYLINLLTLPQPQTGLAPRA